MRVKQRLFLTFHSLFPFISSFLRLSFPQAQTSLLTPQLCITFSWKTSTTLKMTSLWRSKKRLNHVHGSLLRATTSATTTMPPSSTASHLTPGLFPDFFYLLGCCYVRFAVDVDSDVLPLISQLSAQPDVQHIHWTWLHDRRHR